MTVRQRMLDELRDVFLRISEESTLELVNALVGARRIFTYGVGREGLVMSSFCMRLMHLGLDAHVVGDMTTPAIGAGDWLVVSAGPGYFASVVAFEAVARNNGGRVAVLTANPDGLACQNADLVVRVPGQTMAGGEQEVGSIQPMGSLYEQAMWLYLDYVVLRLAERMGQTFTQMAKRHTNLE